MATAKRTTEVGAKGTKGTKGTKGALANKRTHGVVVLSAAVVLLGVLLYLWPQMRLVELGYEQSKLRHQQAAALERQKEFRVELASLRRLSRIEKLAVEKLGMRPPRLSEVIYLRADLGAPPAVAARGER